MCCVSVCLCLYVCVREKDMINYYCTHIIIPALIAFPVHFVTKLVCVVSVQWRCLLPVMYSSTGLGSFCHLIWLLYGFDVEVQEQFRIKFY